jgi:hypothetical protein
MRAIATYTHKEWWKYSFNPSPYVAAKAKQTKIAELPDDTDIAEIEEAARLLTPNNYQFAELEILTT